MTGSNVVRETHASILFMCTDVLLPAERPSMEPGHLQALGGADW